MLLAQLITASLKPHAYLGHYPESLEENLMLRYALIFLVIALIAAFFGFSGVAAGAAGIAQILFYIFLAIFVISLIMSLLRGAA